MLKIIQGLRTRVLCEDYKERWVYSKTSKWLYKSSAIIDANWQLSALLKVWSPPSQLVPPQSTRPQQSTRSPSRMVPSHSTEHFPPTSFHWIFSTKYFHQQFSTVYFPLLFYPNVSIKNCSPKKSSKKYSKVQDHTFAQFTWSSLVQVWLFWLVLSSAVRWLLIA